VHSVIEIFNTEQKSAFKPLDLIDPGLQYDRGTIYPVFNLVKRLGLSRWWPTGFAVEGAEGFEIGQSISLREKKNFPSSIDADMVVKMAQIEKETRSPASLPSVGPRLVKSSVLEDDQEVEILDFERLFYAR
jgi:hypothetical protein